MQTSSNNPAVWCIADMMEAASEHEFHVRHHDWDSLAEPFKTTLTKELVRLGVGVDDIVHDRMTATASSREIAVICAGDEDVPEVFLWLAADKDGLLGFRP